MANFVPHVKRKLPSNNNATTVVPFPECRCNESNELVYFNGIFTGISVEVPEKADIIKIYESGYFGKGSKSRGAPKVVTQKQSEQKTDEELDETLTLDLEEAFFLAYSWRVLKIHNLQEQEMDTAAYVQAAELAKPNFLECLAGYYYFKRRGWVVKTGVKFGGDFLVYRKGPRFFHATFVVFIRLPDDKNFFVPRHLKGLQRIAETSDKTVILLDIHKPAEFKLERPADLRDITVRETVITRFNYTAFAKCTTNTTK